MASASTRGASPGASGNGPWLFGMLPARVDVSLGRANRRLILERRWRQAIAACSTLPCAAMPAPNGASGGDAAESIPPCCINSSLPSVVERTLGAG